MGVATRRPAPRGGPFARMDPAAWRWTVRERAGLRGDLADRFGYSPFGSPSPDHPTIVLALRRLDISITRTKTHMTATVSGFDGNGEPLFDPRSTTHPRQDCEQLRGMVAAMATDAIRSFIPPLPKADPPAPASAKPTAASTAQPTAVVSSVRTPFPVVGFGAGLDIATAPVAMVGQEYHVGLRWTDFSLGLEARVYFGVAGIGVRDTGAWLWAITLAPCLHEGVMFGCGLASLGERRFTAGHGLEPHVRNPVFAAVGLRAGVAWPLPRAPSPEVCSRFPHRPCAPSVIRFTADLLHAPLTSTLLLNKVPVWSSFPISANFSVAFQSF